MKKIILLLSFSLLLSSCTTVKTTVKPCAPFNFTILKTVPKVEVRVYNDDINVYTEFINKLREQKDTYDKQITRYYEKCPKRDD